MPSPIRSTPVSALVLADRPRSKRNARSILEPNANALCVAAAVNDRTLNGTVGNDIHAEAAGTVLRLILGRRRGQRLNRSYGERERDE